MPRKRVPRVRVCEFCGNLIGPDRGPAAKTCSYECQRDRNNAREKIRYQQIKHTPEWKASRVDYIERLKTKLKTDPDFAERFKRSRATAVQKFRAALEQDPGRYAEYLERHRAWHHNMTPEQRENKRARNRAWYANLDPEFKQLFLLQLRMRRAQKQLEEAE